MIFFMQQMQYYATYCKYVFQKCSGVTPRFDAGTQNRAPSPTKSWLCACYWPDKHIWYRWPLRFSMHFDMRLTKLFGVQWSKAQRKIISRVVRLKTAPVKRRQCVLWDNTASWKFMTGASLSSVLWSLPFFILYTTDIGVVSFSELISSTRLASLVVRAVEDKCRSQAGLYLLSTTTRRPHLSDEMTFKRTK